METSPISMLILQMDLDCCSPSSQCPGSVGAGHDPYLAIYIPISPGHNVFLSLIAVGQRPTHTF